MQKIIFYTKQEMSGYKNVTTEVQGFFPTCVCRGHLMIPSHISVLHVEQEVEGDETIALESVLECDEEREKLLREEKTISLQLSSRYITSCD